MRQLSQIQQQAEDRLEQGAASRQALVVGLCQLRIPTMLVMALDIRLDHSVLAISDWETSNRFYRDVLGAQLVPHGEPPRVAYRLGDTQLNVHRPGVDLSSNVAKLPVQPGNSDLCFAWPGPIEGAIAHLARLASKWRPDR
jgi:hypothetical protein